MNLIKDKSGTTLAEILISFTLLIFIFSMFFRGVKVSQNLTQKAQEIQGEVQSDIRLFYEKAQSVESDESETSKVKKKADENNTSITIKNKEGTTLFTLDGQLYEYEIEHASGSDPGKFYYWEAGDSD
jgi:hypothetical protein